MAVLVKAKYSSTRKKRKPLILAQYADNGNGIVRIQKDLRRAILPIIFEINDKQELYYEALMHLSPINRSVRKTPSSITKGIEQALKHFGLDVKAEVEVLKGDKLVSVESKEEDPSKVFEDWVLGFETPPKWHLDLLRPKVESHLKYANELIKHYESLPSVQKFLKEGRIRGDHRTRTILDFYIRCQEERQTILDYYFQGVFDRAIKKSFPKSWNLGISFPFEDLYDFPYSIGNRFSRRSIDYREIDCVSHRIGGFPIREYHEMQKLYEKSKSKFYKAFFKRRSKEQVFQTIFFHLDYVPLSRDKDRKEIFKELERLFLKKRWMAFYALALPQVEGLFAEMIKSADPSSKIIVKALPDKVKSVRPDYDLSHAYFDYYEYELPNQRNSFSHTGFADEIQLRAYDILTDLEHVLSVFAGLNTPLVKLTALIKRRDQLVFSNYEAFRDYFNVLKKLHKEQKTDDHLNQEIDGFHANFLKESCSLEFIISEAANKLRETTEKVTSTIDHAFASSDDSEWWTRNSFPELKKRLSDPEFQEKVDDFFTYNNVDVNELFILNEFFSGALEFLYNNRVPPELKPEFGVWEEHKKFINWLSKLQKLAENLNMKEEP